jgi:hypothetical protein
MMKSASFVTGQDSPLKDRWGGWYVTGTSGRQQHMGNVIVQDRDHPELLDRASSRISPISATASTSPSISPLTAT